MMPSFLRYLMATVLGVLLLGSSGCRVVPIAEEETMSASLGKVHIRYQYTEMDKERPPKAFVVLRSKAQGGPFSAINEKPIPAREKFESGTVQLLATDYGLEMDSTYYYYLERVERNGQRHKAAPVTEVRVTLPLTKEDRREWERLQARKAEEKREGIRREG